MFTAEAETLTKRKNRVIWERTTLLGKSLLTKEKCQEGLAGRGLLCLHGTETKLKQKARFMESIKSTCKLLLGHQLREQMDVGFLSPFTPLSAWSLGRSLIQVKQVVLRDPGVLQHHPGISRRNTLLFTAASGTSSAISEMSAISRVS